MDKINNCQLPKHLLVVRLSAMGDVAMSVPVLEALLEHHKDIRITIVSRPFFKPFFEGLDRIDFFAVDLKQRHKGFFGIFRLFFDLRKQKIEAVADLHNVLRSKILRLLFRLFGQKTAAINKGRSEKKALTRPYHKVFKPLKTTHQRYAEVFEALGYKIDLNNFKHKLSLTLSDKTEVVSGKKDKVWLGIAPFAQYTSKVYPADLMQQLIDILAQNKDYKLLLFGGGAKEIRLLETFAKDHKNVVVVAGKLDFNEELKLIANLDLMLSMDSGNAHIAAMYGVRTLIIFGATHPFAGFMPYGQPMEHAFIPDLEKYPKLPTSVYGNKIIKGYEEAMRTITPQSVALKISEVLRNEE